MAHKKGAGSVKNGRESHSKRLGVKLFGGQVAVGADRGHGADAAGGEGLDGAEVYEVDFAEGGDFVSGADQQIAGFDGLVDDRGGAIVKVAQNVEYGECQVFGGGFAKDFSCF